MAHPPSVPAQLPFSSIEEWALHYIESDQLSVKTDPLPAPSVFSNPQARRDLRPGRPEQLKTTSKKPKSFRLGALHRPEVRAALHHKFWHHELQAAELMCWAILAYPEAPEEFRKGLVRIFKDEVRHMKMYQLYIESLGFSLGQFEVRDWFWERVPTCESPLQFVALLGMGLEGANLDHTARFSAWLRTVGDTQGAELQEQVGREEIAHVRFANRWFEVWTGGVDFDEWQKSLPPPLSPLLMRGKNIQVNARLKAEFPLAFVENLRDWHPDQASS